MTGSDQSPANVVPLVAPVGRKPAKPKPQAIGTNEQAVLDQAAQLPKADQQPATVQQALTLARLLDDDACKAMWPTTSRQLHVLLLSLAGPKAKSKSRILAIQKMTNRRPRGAESSAALGD